MNRNHTAAILSLSLALALLLPGCRRDTSPGSLTPSPSPAATAPAEDSPWSAFTDTGIRFALCTSPGSVIDTPNSVACYSALNALVSSRGKGDTSTPLQEPTGDAASVCAAYDNAIPSYDVMICVGSAFAQFGSVAQAHPDKQFILVDVPCQDENGNALTLDNVYCIEFAEQECAFYAGVAAAMETRTGRVAVVTDVPSPISQRYYYGFRSGVAYANGNLGTSADVIDHPAYAGIDSAGNSLGGNYTLGSADTAYALANSLVDESCDILFSADESYPGVFAAAQARDNVRVIGAPVDQSAQGAGVLLTSVTKDYDACLLRVLEAIADGSFRGGNHVFTAKDNATGYVAAEGYHQLSAETLTALEGVAALMREGSIVPGTGPQ